MVPESTFFKSWAINFPLKLYLNHYLSIAIFLISSSCIELSFKQTFFLCMTENSVLYKTHFANDFSKKDKKS